MKAEKSTKGRKLTSDSDRTGGLTQSSQHFDSSVSRTSAGLIPSHCVRNCSWRRFSWQNISVRKAMNAVKRGRDGFFEFAMTPKTLSRSWYHWRQVFKRASKNVSFCSFEMIEMQSREIGSEYLKYNSQKSAKFLIKNPKKEKHRPPALDSPVHAVRCQVHETARSQLIWILRCFADDRHHLWRKRTDVLDTQTESEARNSSGQGICRRHRLRPLQRKRLEKTVIQNDIRAVG